MPLLAMSIDTSPAVEQLKALLDTFQEQADERVMHDMAAWPDRVAAELHKRRQRPKNDDNLARAFSAEADTSKKHIVKCSLVVDTELAPHWVSIEYGSVESGKPTDREGMPVLPGWFNQVRMSTRPMRGKNVSAHLWGRFVPGPAAPTRSRAAKTIQTMGKPAEAVDFGASGAAYPGDGSVFYPINITRNITPHGFIYAATKAQWKETTASLKQSFIRATKRPRGFKPKKKLT